MSSAADSIARLITILEAEEELYKSMQRCLKGEREKLIALDVEGIEDAVAEKEMLADEGKLLEESRLEVCASLGAALGLASPSPSLRELSGALGGAGQAIDELRARINALIGAVRELMLANDHLTGVSLAKVRGSLRLLGQNVPDGPVYGPRGHALTEQPVGRVFRQAV